MMRFTTLLLALLAVSDAFMTAPTSRMVSEKAHLRVSDPTGKRIFRRFGFP